MHFIFNLQPSCTKCNKLKSNKDDILPFCLFTDDKSKLDPFDFSILHVSCAQYLATHDRDMLRIIFSSNEPGLKDNMDALFHISTQYQAHKEMVEELIWKNKSIIVPSLIFTKITLSNWGLSRQTLIALSCRIMIRAKTF